MFRRAGVVFHRLCSILRTKKCDSTPLTGYFFLTCYNQPIRISYRLDHFVRQTIDSSGQVVRLFGLRPDHMPTQLFVLHPLSNSTLTIVSVNDRSSCRRRTHFKLVCHPNIHFNFYSLFFLSESHVLCSLCLARLPQSNAFFSSLNSCFNLLSVCSPLLVFFKRISIAANTTIASSCSLIVHRTFTYGWLL